MFSLWSSQFTRTIIIAKKPRSVFSIEFWDFLSLPGMSRCSWSWNKFQVRAHPVACKFMVMPDHESPKWILFKVSYIRPGGRPRARGEARGEGRKRKRRAGRKRAGAVVCRKNFRIHKYNLNDSRYPVPDISVTDEWTSIMMVRHTKLSAGNLIKKFPRRYNRDRITRRRKYVDGQRNPVCWWLITR